MKKHRVQHLGIFRKLHNINTKRIKKFINSNEWRTNNYKKSPAD